MLTEGELFEVCPQMEPEIAPLVVDEFKWF